jgi:FlaA1/EpsC-like NDP-sugar epimerase
VTDADTRREMSTYFRGWLLDLPRRKKRVLLAVLDFLSLSTILWLGMSIRYGFFYRPADWNVALLLVSAPLLTIATLSYSGLYRFVSRYLGTHGHKRIVVSFAVSVLLWSLVVFMSGQLGIPRSVIVLYGIVGAPLLILSRQMIAWLLSSYGIVLPKFDPGTSRDPVLIYGAGPGGVELACALARLPAYDVVGFCDSSPTLWGQYISNVRVHRPDRLARVVERFGIKQILLPSVDRSERRRILKEIEKLPVTVKVLPSLEDIASGRVDVTELRPLDVEDLLGRDSVSPVTNLLSRNIKGKNVLVTGAGGSLGSEIARKVFSQGASRIVLLDVAEAALYDIDIELRDTIASRTKVRSAPQIIPVLGSVLDRSLLIDILRRHEISTIYHAAAYKHVPLVENNAPAGIENNVFGTNVVADAALACNVDRMVLVSTDKAARPANVMAASQRLAELALQARAAKEPVTTFAIVRFGNVLDSSGSVVGRFRRQIKTGGPITVTHPDVIRHFMSIPEAAELVIQAGAMARCGDVFALEMGDPIKIDELARLMVRLSGLEVKDTANPDGDIEIAYTGLRPGEKLEEEFPLGASSMATEHPRILRLDEPAIDAEELEREFDLLRASIKLRDTPMLQAILMRTVEGYRPDADVIATKAIPIASHVAPSRTLH